MPVRRRYLAPQVLRDLRRKMVFVSGPRQVGKTTLARSLPGARVGYLKSRCASPHSLARANASPSSPARRSPSERSHGAPHSVSSISDDLRPADAMSLRILQQRLQH